MQSNNSCSACGSSQGCGSEVEEYISSVVDIA